MQTLSIDMGGSYLRSLYIDEDQKAHYFTQESSKQTLFEYISSMLKTYKHIKRVGIAYAGQVDKGTILGSPNIVIDTPDIVDALQSRFDVKVAIDNDINCAALALQNKLNISHMALLFVGTGVGAAYIDGGHLVRGANSMAMELGHIAYREAPFVCGCGKNNCVELFASGSGLQKWFDYYGYHEAVKLETLSNFHKTLYTQWFEALTLASGMLISLTNPKVLVLGGGVLAHEKDIAFKLYEALKGQVMPIQLENLKIIYSDIDDAPLKGAQLLQEAL